VIRARATRCAAVLVWTCAAAVAGSGGGRGESVETRTRQETIALQGERGLCVDGFFGSITVRGADVQEIRMQLRETVSAATAAAAERARREVAVEIARRDGRVVIRVDGPFRESFDCTEWSRRRRRDPDYRVTHDFELEVPREIDLELSTVFGDIDVAGVERHFDVQGVNGAVRMDGVSGAGRAGTVNGPLRLVFARNPREDCEFSTVNGRIDVGFEAPLSADLSFHTMNGDARTDFEYAVLPPSPLRVHSDGGRTTYKIDSRVTVRIGDGDGPRIRLDTLNGDIVVHRNE
jgi:hypothetical protein